MSISGDIFVDNDDNNDNNDDNYKTDYFTPCACVQGNYVRVLSCCTFIIKVLLCDLPILRLAPRQYQTLALI